MHAHDDGVRSFRRCPHRTQWRHNPNAFNCLDGRHPFRRKEQLVFKVGMLRDDMAMGKIPRTSGHLREAAAIFIEEKGVARSRHLLSP